MDGGTAAAVIPARYRSMRFPGKILAEIDGKPLLYRVYRQASSCPLFKEVIVATDDERIFRTAQDFGARAVMTSPGCRTGTDRVAEVARGIQAPVIVNVQADYPDIAPEDLASVVQFLRGHPEIPIATLKQSFGGLEEIDNPHRVKVIYDANEFAIKFTRRLPVGESGSYGEHIGVYGFQREALLKFGELPQSPLEKEESLEQLRALENGMRIKVLTAKKRCHGVNVPEDLWKKQFAKSPA